MAELEFFKLYIKDLLDSDRYRKMSWDEKGIYLHLIINCYRLKNRLMCNAGWLSAECDFDVLSMDKVESILKANFSQVSERGKQYWMHDAVEREMIKTLSGRDRMSQGGKNAQETLRKKREEMYQEDDQTGGQKTAQNKVGSKVPLNGSLNGTLRKHNEYEDERIEGTLQGTSSHSPSYSEMEKRGVGEKGKTNLQTFNPQKIFDRLLVDEDFHDFLISQGITPEGKAIAGIRKFYQFARETRKTWTDESDLRSHMGHWLKKQKWTADQWVEEESEPPAASEFLLSRGFLPLENGRWSFQGPTQLWTQENVYQALGDVIITGYEQKMWENLRRPFPKRLEKLHAFLENVGENEAVKVAIRFLEFKKKFDDWQAWRKRTDGQFHPENSGPMTYIESGNYRTEPRIGHDDIDGWNDED